MSSALPRKRRPGESAAGPIGRDRSPIYLGWIAVGTLLGVVAGAVYFFLHTTRPAFRAVVITEYGRWPVNPFADRDRDRLLPLFQDTGEVFADQRLDSLRSRLASFAELSRQDALIVYVNAFAVVIGDAVAVVPSGAGDPPGPAQTLPVAELIRAVSASPARHKFLMLDLARPVDDPCHDLRPEWVSARLHEQLDSYRRSGELAVAVLTSCGPGQRSHPAPAVHASAFAWFLDRGLRGEADAPASTDKVIESDELAEYVRHRVRDYVALVHGAVQEPRYYKPDKVGKPFALNPSPRGEVDAAPPGEYPDSLRRAWKLFGQYAAAPTLPTDAPELLRLQRRLLGEEQNWRFLESNRFSPARVGEIEAALKQWASASSARRVGSIAPVLSDDEKGSPIVADLRAKLVKAESILAKEFAAKPNEEPGEKKEVADFMAAAQPPPSDGPPPTPHPLDAARSLVWDRLINPKPSDDPAVPPRAVLRAGLVLLEKLGLSDDDSRLVRRNGLLEQLAKSNAWVVTTRGWPDQAVHLALRAEHAALRLAGELPDPEAVRKKSDGEAKLARVGDSANGRPADDARAAEDLLRTAVDRLERQAADLGDRWQREGVRRETVRRIVGLAHYLAVRPAPRPVVEEWKSAADAISALDAAGGSPADARRRARQVFEKLNPAEVLERGHAIVTAKEPEKLELPKDAAALAQELRAWLATPVLTDEQRAVAWKALTWLERKAHDRAMELLSAGRGGGDPEGRPAPTIDRIRAGVEKFVGACGPR